MHETCFGRSAVASPSQMKKFVESDPEFLSHQLKAVQLVNRQIKARSVSDALIATVMTLVWRQVSYH
jgi:hypothetical protein